MLLCNIGFLLECEYMCVSVFCAILFFLSDTIRLDDVIVLLSAISF